MEDTILYSDNDVTLSTFNQLSPVIKSNSNLDSEEDESDDEDGLLNL